MVSSQDLTGRRIGNLTFGELLGWGGMGAVYVAQDETLLRRVAVKAIHGDKRLNPEAKARFLREGRLLSQLRHPGVCTVHSFIEGDEIDLLVMELVEGANLRDAMRAGLAQQQKLAIAAQLLDVLVAVHGEGLVHRDLKPANVMITPAGAVKVLDFGLARPVGDSLETGPDQPPRAQPTTRLGSESTVVIAGEPAPASDSESGSGATSTIKTMAGSIVGSLGYMSPEQAAGEPATAASDMYSLGIILQELFTGERAFEHGADPLELLALTAAGQTRPVTGLPPDLARLIERLKRPVPAARPTSLDARALLAEYLQRPRRARRRRLLVAVWAVVAAFAVAMTVQSLRVARAADRAEREARAANRVADFLVNLFTVPDPSEARGNEVTARELLDAGAATVPRELGDDPLLRARLEEVIARTYNGLGLFRQAEPLAQSALAIREAAVGRSDVSLIEPLEALGQSRWQQGRWDEARTALERAVAITAATYGSDDPRTAASQVMLADLSITMGQTDGVEPGLTAAVAVLERAGEHEGKHLSLALHSLARLCRSQSRFDEAEALLRRALAIDERVLGEDHPDCIASLQNLGHLYLVQGRADDAIPLLQRSLALTERVLGPAHLRTATALHNLGHAYSLTGRLDEAEALLLRALDINRDVTGPDAGRIDQSYALLGTIYYRRGDLERAEALLRRALEACRSVFGAEQTQIIPHLNNLSRLLARRGRLDEAEPLLREAIGQQEKAFGDSSPDLAILLSNLGELLETRRDMTAAETCHARAVAILDRPELAGHGYRERVFGRYAAFLEANGRAAQAASMRERIAPAAR